MTYESHTIELVQEVSGLKSLVTHYIPEHRAPDGQGVTLVFSHSTSNHKEQWEIIISQLFELCYGIIDEVWAVEWQNHGHSAILNAQILSNRIATLNDYADALRQLLESRHLKGKRVVLIGHSTGTCAWMLAIFQAVLLAVKIEGVILFEPVFICPPVTKDDDRILRGIMNVRGVKTRKATFPSRDEAAKYARERMPWMTWDERMFSCYMKYGFREVSSDSSEVTLNCTLDQEVEACAPYVPILSGYLYPQLCALYKVHGIFGVRPEMYTNATRDRFFDGKDGHNMASVQIIPKAGHLLVQEFPDTAAKMIAAVLKGKAPAGNLARPRL